MSKERRSRSEKDRKGERMMERKRIEFYATSRDRIMNGGKLGKGIILRFKYEKPKKMYPRREKSKNIRVQK